MTRPKPTLPASKSERPTASRFYHFAPQYHHDEQLVLKTPVPETPAPAAASRSAKNPKTGTVKRNQGQVVIREELARRERIKNDDAEQDILLKRTSLTRLFRFLTAETIAVFLLAFLQGIQAPWGFRLEEWSFKILITATIAQITAMLFVAVRYLFPTK